MNLRQLEYFLAAAKQRSLGRAAETSNISQPAISKAIRELERELGVSLLNRLPRGVETTHYGEILELRATSILRALARAEDELKAIKAGETGTISVGVGSSMRLNLLPDAILRLKSRHPKVEFRVISKLQDGLIEDVQKGNIEIAICELSISESNPTTTEIPLYADSMRAAVRREHDLLKKPNLKPADCLEYDWILPPSKHLQRDRLDSLFLNLGLPRLNPAVESESTLFAMSLLKRCDMISWHPKSVIEEFSDQVALLPVSEFELPRKVGIVHMADMQFTTATRMLVDELQTGSRNMIDIGRVSAP